MSEVGGRSFGVEEEFLLADPAIGRTVPAAAEVLAAAAAAPAAAPDAAVHSELLRTQVEAATGRCLSLAELAGQLTHGRRRLAAAAKAAGVWLVPSATAVLGTDPVGTLATPGERFAAISDRYAEVVREYQACGCHVHVGVPDPDTAVAVVNHLRPWLPTLLALSANSPIHHGRDTGYASWRTLEQSRFPGGGVPPWFGSSADYTARVDELVELGVLHDRQMTFWLARPSAHLPTVELRVADTAIDVDGAVLQAALSRALVATALVDLARGREAPGADDQVLAAALWSAARYGMAGPAVHPVLVRRVPATVLLSELVTRVVPALVEAGDLDAVLNILGQLRRGGTGAQRQRAVADPFRVVRSLTVEESE